MSGEAYQVLITYDMVMFDAILVSFIGRQQVASRPLAGARNRGAALQPPASSTAYRELTKCSYPLMPPCFSREEPSQ
jgi:hypothetical protein